MKEVTEINGERILWAIGCMLVGGLLSAVTGDPLGVPIVFVGIGLIFSVGPVSTIGPISPCEGRSPTSEGQHYRSRELILRDARGRIVAQREIHKWTN